MKKAFLIGLKDLRIAFRDRAALILMLGAPFLLTLGLGLVTGRFSGSTSSGLADIPVVIVDLDQDQLGKALVDVFHSADLADLLDPSESSDPAAARSLVDADKSAAAVIIPAGFTRSIMPQQGDFNADSVPLQAVKIEIYANPSRPTSAGIIQAVVDEFLSRVQEQRTKGSTAILQMMASGLISQTDAEAAGLAMGERMKNDPTAGDLTIKVLRSTNGAAAQEFDALAYIAPAMALMFLMYTVSYGGRSILAERSQGTLPRLLVSPTGTAQILGGKVLGIFLTGAAQVLILIGATALLFRVRWGDPAGLIVLSLAAVFAACGWGLLITALAKTPGQVSSTGTTLMLAFGILGGSFIQLDQMPPLVQVIGRLTPNAWALDGYTLLGSGGTLADLSTPILALLAMGAALFTAAVLLFRGKDLASK